MTEGRLEGMARSKVQDRQALTSQVDWMQKAGVHKHHLECTQGPAQGGVGRGRSTALPVNPELTRHNFPRICTPGTWTPSQRGKQVV